MGAWPEQEWRELCRRNPHTGNFNLSFRELAALLAELDETRRMLQRERRIVDRLLTEPMEPSLEQL